MAKYKSYPEYKDSGVESLDTIPKMWAIKKLKYIFEIKKRIAGKIGFDVLSVTQKGIKIKDTESGEGQLSMDYSKYQRVYPGEFAMNHMDLLTGYVDISNYDGVTSPDYRVFAVRDKHSFYSRYYLYLLQDGYKQRRFFHLGQGSAHLGRWRLPTEAFNEIVYPCPSRKEQIHIASFLDHETAKIDNLIEKQQQLIELLKEKRQAVISHAVTKGLNPNVPMKDSGVEWLGEVPEHWIVSGFKKYLSSIVDYRGKTPNKTDDGILLVTARNIKKGELDYTLSQEFIAPSDYKEVMSRGLPDIGDVLFTTEAPLGEVANVDRVDIALAQRIIKFKGMISRLNNYYFKYFIMSSSFQQSLNLYSSGSTAQGIKAERFVYLRKLLPPINEQMQIVDFLDKEISKIDILVEQQFVMLSLLQERRTALISAAVTGKIDVRDWVAPDTQKADKVKETAA
ncbi:restriction endonuclease subunit S [Providencia rettgeri]|uniref:restriction endonuclease subunit S n=1 Tax=Providencia TaxID=586 RepID=UPI0024AA549F|nr:restriction endonuclease subunit S [Providencia rettgeri]MCW4541115.1 restriction endonuclease subunit S [Providencia rettgeri]MDX4117736.1 restriction endonuclease subunit S [Providencia rettgeri]